MDPRSKYMEKSLRGMVPSPVVQHEPEIFVSRGIFGSRVSDTHTHGTCEIVLYLKGRGTVLHGQKNHGFGPGTVTYTPPGVFHREASTSGWESIWVTFPMRKQNPQGPLVFQDAPHGPMQKLLELLHHEYQKVPGQPGEVFDHLLLAIQAMLAEHRSTEPLSGEMHALRDRIISHLADAEFSLEKTLGQMSISRALVFRKFRATFQMTPARFLVERRLKQARSLLDLPDLSVREVAQQVGYADPFHFSKAFKKEFGRSPREYRRQMVERVSRHREVK